MVLCIFWILILYQMDSWQRVFLSVDFLFTWLFLLLYRGFLVLWCPFVNFGQLVNSWANEILFRKFFPMLLSYACVFYRQFRYFRFHTEVFAPFGVDFVQGVRYGSNFISPRVDVQLPQNRLLKILFYLHCVFWHLCPISTDCNYVHQSWVFSFVLLISMSVFASILLLLLLWF